MLDTAPPYMYGGAVSSIIKIKKLELERDNLMRDLIKTDQMIRGTYGVNHRRCGTSTCWCSSAKKGHPHNRITWSENAKSYTKVIPKEEIEWIKIVTENYKCFRNSRKRLREINEEIRSLLTELENQIIEKTKKRRKYL